tara:strand:+ start:430 stop:663 length:234 start_codon:yes stop_codon:yes gene_type:complete
MEKNWDSVRKQYAGIIQNLINNIDICNRRFVEQGDGGYLVQREVYIKEVEEIKTFIVKKELEMELYKKESNDEEEEE